MAVECQPTCEYRPTAGSQCCFGQTDPSLISVLCVSMLFFSREFNTVGKFGNILNPLE